MMTIKNTFGGILFAGLSAVQMNAQAVPVYDQGGNRLHLDGRVLGRHFFSQNKAMSGDAVIARINLWAETDINDQMYGYSRFEHDFRANKAESEPGEDYTRYAYVGLSAREYGYFDYGRNDSIFYDVVRWTDIFPVWGAGSFAIDNFLSRRGSGAFSYHNRDFFSLVKGLEAGIQFQGKKEGNTPVLKQNGNGYGLSLTYKIPETGLTVGGSSIRSSRTDAQKKLSPGRGDNMDAWVAGANLEHGPFYAAVLYSESRNLSQVRSSPLNIYGFANKAKSFEAVASWNTPLRFTASVGYIQSRAERLESIGQAWLDKAWVFFAAWPFNDNFRITTEYKMSLLKDDNALRLASQDAVAVTMIYVF
ncbi:porin [Tatumella sp. JGM118]|uniref:porin n=1 Tax=Tatumella sp. JGM118 TaxID=2799796 RepID=UPI001BAFDB94|nr:porin [Tatumella sp. JGM118]MBS0909543.1 porin [Tatumella sp. JGM118]